jgi:glycosyltransferase involved in cell wall biosynthesis
VSELSSEGGAVRRVVVARDGVDERADLFVHALAQLADAVQLEIRAPGNASERLQTLARAYGIQNRLQVIPDPDQAGAAAVIRARSAVASGNAAGADDLHWTVERASGAPVAVSSMAELVEALSEPEDPPASCRGADEILDGHRIAVVTNLPTHYRVPLFNGVHERVAAAGGQLRVLFTTGDPRSARPWLRPASIEFDHRFLTSIGTRPGSKAPIDLGRELRRFDPTLVVSGGFSPLVTGRVLALAQRKAIPWGLWSGDTHLQASARGRLRLAERRWIARRANFAISYGWLSREYLRALNPVLSTVIARNTAPFPADPQPAVRPSDSPVEFLAVSRAIKGKGLEVLVDMFRRMAPGRARLTLVGDGPELKRLMSAAGGSDQIRFLGAVDTDRVLECYRDAQAFLFPSQIDVFGLVLVEAMGGGLAAVTAKAPGAVGDLCVEGRTALVMADNDPGRWAQAVSRLVEDQDLRDRLAANGRQTILRRWTMSHSVDAFIAGLRLGLSR